MTTTQDALSGTEYNVYSFALMFRPPGLQIIIYAEKVSMCEYWISTFIAPCTSAHVLWLTTDSGTPFSSIAGQGEQGSQTASSLIFRSFMLLSSLLSSALVASIVPHSQTSKALIQDTGKSSLARQTIHNRKAEERSGGSRLLCNCNSLVSETKASHMLSNYFRSHAFNSTIII